MKAMKKDTKTYNAIIRCRNIHHFAIEHVLVHNLCMLMKPIQEIVVVPDVSKIINIIINSINKCPFD